MISLLKTSLVLYKNDVLLTYGLHLKSEQIFEKNKLCIF